VQHANPACRELQAEELPPVVVGLVEEKQDVGALMVMVVERERACLLAEGELIRGCFRMEVLLYGGSQLSCQFAFLKAGSPPDGERISIQNTFLRCRWPESPTFHMSTVWGSLRSNGTKGSISEAAIISRQPT
jgi:hypothetical protein